ncbi:MAG TPA: hypothetical protein VMT64_13155, partial [Candidatus Binataceae bacterium]|nr:hypothetical protein [Candidatus Binataceae bacterium]
MGIAVVFAAMLICASMGPAWAADIASSGASAPANLLRNSELKTLPGIVPPGWRVHTIPDCGFKSASHPEANGTNNFELINQNPIESIFYQTIHLPPGWYSFSAEIKIESMGTEGAAPELFVKASSFAVDHRVHPVEWSDDWQTYHTVFRAGDRVSDFQVGCALGQWGNPNRGRFLFRNPVLTAAENPANLKNQGMQGHEGFDMEGTVENRYFKATAQQVGAVKVVKPAIKSNLFNQRWSIIALNVGLLGFALLGWRT